jgi:hypothetical protein
MIGPAGVPESWSMEPDSSTVKPIPSLARSI